jgi:hypothetical protein
MMMRVSEFHDLSLSLSQLRVFSFLSANVIETHVRMLAMLIITFSNFKDCPSDIQLLISVRE